MANKKSKMVLKPLISEFDLKLRVTNLVKEIADDFEGEEMVVIGLLKGSFMFMADLVRLFHLHEIPLQIDFMSASSYSGTKSTGKVKISKDITTDISNHWVLLIDDILDTGRTLDAVTNHLKKMQPRIIKTCVLLDKPERRVVPFQADYIGFTVPDEFVVGYGLDYENRYREMPSISMLTFS